MSINMNYLKGNFDLSLPIRLGQISSKENYQSEVKLTKDLKPNEEKSGFTNITALEKMKVTKDHEVEYEINQESQEVIIRIVDRKTGELVRQIPIKQLLKLAQPIEGVNHKYIDDVV